MPKIELIPVNKGNSIALDPTTITTIGRTPQIGCSSNKISRNHAQLSIKSDGTVWIKSIHHNPTFYKTKTNQIVSLTKNKEYQLYHNDQFGLLPDEYFYRVSIKTNEEEDYSTSIIPKKDISMLVNHEEEKSESISEQTRISGSLTSTSTEEDNISELKTITNLPAQERPNVEETKELVQDDVEPIPATSAAEQATTSSRIDLTTNHSPSSTTVDSKRERCSFGASCYRKNPIHRLQAIHPDDSDWDSDDDDQDNAKPLCPYGNECYRTNPDHFTEYHHPKKHSRKNKTKQRASTRRTVEYDDEDDEDEDNPTYDEDIVSTDDTIDDEESNEDEWKPRKDVRYLEETDDDSTDDSDKELVKQEAAEFIKGSTADRNGPVIKKPRVDDE